MIDLRDLSVDADQNPKFGKEIFKREGVLVVKGFLPTHVVQTVAAFLDDALNQLDDLFRQYGISTHDGDAAARLMAVVAQPETCLPENHRHVFLGHFPLEVRLAETLRAIPRFINTRPLLFELLAARRLFAHMPPTARFVLPHCSLARVPPHQDISYNKHMGEFCVAWVPLVPIDGACGGMAVYPRTHGQEILAEGQTAAANGWLPPVETDGDRNGQRVVLAPLEMGDIVILGHRTVHESMPNISDRVRLSCDFRFFSEQSHSKKHYLDISAGVIVAPTPAGV